MSLKDVLTNSLLMFVVATCVVLIVKALPQTPPPQAAAGVSGDGSGQPSPKEQSYANLGRSGRRQGLLPARQYATRPVALSKRMPSRLS